jgi:hypothetical protein
MDRIHTLNARERLAGFVATCDDEWIARLYAVVFAREPVEISDNIDQSWTYHFPESQVRRLSDSMAMEAAWTALTQEASSEDHRSR